MLGLAALSELPLSTLPAAAADESGGGDGGEAGRGVTWYDDAPIRKKSRAGVLRDDHYDEDEELALAMLLLMR